MHTHHARSRQHRGHGRRNGSRLALVGRSVLPAMQLSQRAAEKRLPRDPGQQRTPQCKQLRLPSQQWIVRVKALAKAVAGIEHDPLGRYSHRKRRVQTLLEFVPDQPYDRAFFQGWQAAPLIRHPARMGQHYPAGKLSAKPGHRLVP